MDNFVQLMNISHIYQELTRETLAVKNFNLNIGKGEFIALLGPSGCGKTTLLSILSGMIKPTSGNIVIDGKDAQSFDVGYMLQHDHLLEWQTILSNTLLGLKIRGKLDKQSTALAESLLERYGLADFKKSYPTQLSGGMRQKVALIRTLALNPQLLLLDEPFSALDFQTRLILSNEVSDIIRSEGKTAVLVTHDISEAISLADRIVVLTKRPASIKAIHDVNLKSVVPIERRSDPHFNSYFDMIWNEINDNGGNM